MSFSGFTPGFRQRSQAEGPRFIQHPISPGPHDHSGLGGSHRSRRLTVIRPQGEVHELTPSGRKETPARTPSAGSGSISGGTGTSGFASVFLAKRAASGARLIAVKNPFRFISFSTFGIVCNPEFDSRRIYARERCIRQSCRSSCTKAGTASSVSLVKNLCSNSASVLS